MNSLLLATEAGGDGGAGIGLILPAGAELVYGAIAFTIVYFVLRRLAFPQIDKMLDDRREAIQGRMEEAEAKVTEAEETRRAYEDKLQEARREADRIVEEAKTTAESLRQDIVAKAEAEAQAIVQRAQNEVSNERDRALQELRTEVGQISVELASRIVGKELDASAHQGLVDEYINRLSRQN